MSLLLPLIINFFTIGLIYNRWLLRKQLTTKKIKSKYSFIFLLFSYLIAFNLTPLAWTYSFGWEFGIVYWACASTVLSWAVIIYHKKRSPHSSKISRNTIDIGNDKKVKPYKLLSLDLTVRLQSTYKLLIIIIIPFIFSACLCFFLPLLMNNISTNTLIFFLFSFLIIWPLSILECHKFMHKPTQIIIFSSLSMCMLISVIGTKLV